MTPSKPRRIALSLSVVGALAATMGAATVYTDHDPSSAMTQQAYRVPKSAAPATSTRARRAVHPSATRASSTSATPTTRASAEAETAPKATPVVLSKGAVASAIRHRVMVALHGSSAAAMGVRVDVAGIGPVVDVHGTATLQPASTEKNFTMGTALLTIGPSTRLTTGIKIYGTKDADGAVHGVLVIVGGGDPTLTSRDLAAEAARIRAAGITSISGGIVVDASRFDGEHAGKGWKPSFMPEESGPLSAIVVDGNTYSSLAVRRPDHAAGALMRALLAKAGVAVAPVITVAVDPGGTPLYQHELKSPPLSSIVTQTLKHSINMYAEQLLKEIGARTGSGTAAGGVATIRAEGAKLGVPVTSAIVDGSGLSRMDRQHADTEVAWLEALAASPVADTFYNALPVSCTDGTLIHRMCGTAAAGRVHAKTGTLDGVRALAGYTKTASGRHVTFAFQLAGARNGWAATAAIDRAMAAITSYKG